MRVHLFIPQEKGRYPGVIFYSEIFQVTGPIRRMASALSGHGYLVAVPEVYHEFEPAGTVLAYDQAGSDRGNELKYTKELASYDEDTDALAKFLRGHGSCTGRIGSYGVCLGGHLAVRGRFSPGSERRGRLLSDGYSLRLAGCGQEATTRWRGLGIPRLRSSSFGEDKTRMFRSRAGSRLLGGSMRRRRILNGMSSMPPMRFCATKVHATIRRSRTFA